MEDREEYLKRMAEIRAERRQKDLEAGIYDDSIYEELKRANGQELLEALIGFYRLSYEDQDYLREMAERFLRMGFRLAQPDGWKLVAPIWLEDYRNRKDE